MKEYSFMQKVAREFDNRYRLGPEMRGARSCRSHRADKCLWKFFAS